MERKNITLIGMPGSGKSTVGVLLAKTLGYRFLDADLLIQQREGALLQDILDQRGVEGFLDVPGTRCCVFYPGEGVSPAQRLQMITTGGHNTHVIAVNGNFDDAQSGVKRIFADPAFAAKLDAMGKVLSSANSINFGRLVPQVVYYFSAYADLLAF